MKTLQTLFGVGILVLMYVCVMAMVVLGVLIVSNLMLYLAPNIIGPGMEVFGSVGEFFPSFAVLITLLAACVAVGTSAIHFVEDTFLQTAENTD